MVHVCSQGGRMSVYHTCLNVIIFSSLKRNDGTSMDFPILSFSPSLLPLSTHAKQFGLRGSTSLFILFQKPHLHLRIR
jgi:hypothetical protein